MRRKNFLFITWDGPQTDYLIGLFLPIFIILKKHGYHAHVLQFSWADECKVNKISMCLRDNDIPYKHVRVRTGFLGVAPFASALLSVRIIFRLVNKWRIDFILPRSLMPAIPSLVVNFFFSTKVVFDADGFSADERVDFGNMSSRSLRYRFLKSVERRISRKAARILVRTENAKDIICNLYGVRPSRVHVVVNGRDKEPYFNYTPDFKGKELRVCYVGSIGDQYCPELMFSLVKAIRLVCPDLRFYIFTGDCENAEVASRNAGVFGASWLNIERVAPDAIPGRLLECDIGIALRKESFSTIGVSPIKLGDYLLGGLPIIGTPGVGNTAPLISDGVFCPLSGEDDIPIAVSWVSSVFLPNRREFHARAQSLGLDYFSLDRAVHSYLLALDGL